MDPSNRLYIKYWKLCKYLTLIAVILIFTCFFVYSGEYTNHTINFHKKKILFYGPGNTSDKASININDYDIVIITNNMVTLFFNRYNKIKGHVILLTNYIYTTTHLPNILQHDKHISGYITVNKHCHDLLRKEISNNKDIITVTEHHVDSVPLGLTRVLMFLDSEQIYFENLHITGVTFYNNKDPIKNYENPEYKIKQLNHKDIGAGPHKIANDISYTRNFIKNHKNNTSFSDELKDILQS